MTNLLPALRPGMVFMLSKPADTLYNKIVPPVIRWATGSEYHHCGISAIVTGNLFIIESIAPGFIPTRPAAEWVRYWEGRGGKVMILEYNRLSPSPDKIQTETAYYIGRGYDFKSTFWHHLGYALRKMLFGISKWKGHTGEKAKESINCSEVLGYIFELGDESYKITPADIINLSKPAYIGHEPLFNKVYETGN